MKLKCTLPRDGIEGDLELFDANGNKLGAIFDSEGKPVQLAGWTWVPQFMLSHSKPYVLFMETMDKFKKNIQRSVLTLSGTTGRVQMYDRTAPVEPRVDIQEPKESKKAK